MKIRTTVLCLPIKNSERTKLFYEHVFGLKELDNEEGIVTIELPHLSLFLMEQAAFEEYSKRARRLSYFPTNQVGAFISCALDSQEDVDLALQNAPLYGGTAPAEATIDRKYGGYIGYITDPDGHLWELVYPQQK